MFFFKLLFLLQILGDWTGDLYNFMNPDKKLGVVQENLLAAPDGLPILRIDGPFGAASEDVFGFKTVVLVGGGIGGTLFLCARSYFSFV